MGLYRRFTVSTIPSLYYTFTTYTSTDEQHTLCANGTAGGPPAAAGATVTLEDGSTYTCVKDPWADPPKNEENKWEIHQMPIKASYADAFYRACANDQFCDSGSFWTCEGLYHQYLADEEGEKEKEIEVWARKIDR